MYFNFNIIFEFLNLGALNTVRPEEFQTVLQEKIQDLLMVSYISTLAQTQLAISAKINAIL
jgi:hypothetical protein